MLKFVKPFILFVAAGFLMTGCATSGSPISGVFYTNVKSPVAVTGNAGCSKVGQAQATSVLGVVATGDASVEAAAKSAGITKIHHVDKHTTDILGLFSTYTIYVYGE